MFCYATSYVVILILRVYSVSSATLLTDHPTCHDGFTWWTIHKDILFNQAVNLRGPRNPVLSITWDTAVKELPRESTWSCVTIRSKERSRGHTTTTTATTTTTIITIIIIVWRSSWRYVSITIIINSVVMIFSTKTRQCNECLSISKSDGKFGHRHEKLPLLCIIWTKNNWKCYKKTSFPHTNMLA